MGNWFASKKSQCSCNYGIGKDGRIGLYVEEKDRSWCSSSGSNDNRAITIECASDKKHPYAINDKVYESLVKLCADICKRNNIKELRWKGDKSLIGQVNKQNMTVHKWFKNKDCPGKYIYDRLGLIANEVNSMLGDDFVSEIQRVIGAKVDGIAGPETLSKTITVSSTINRKHPIVKILQKRLYSLGYTEIGSADGIAGPKFTKAVKNYQRDNKCVVDGEITAKKTTWSKLLGMK